MITQERLKELIVYEPDSGTFTWASSGRSHRWKGEPAGWMDDDGYLWIRLDTKLYSAHRLAWLYMTGSWPLLGFIDHIDTVPSNNKWSNLRDATRRTNQENRRTAGTNNKTGMLGVSPNGERWAASIVSKGKKLHIGTYDTPELAHAAYIEMKRQLHEGCTL